MGYACPVCGVPQRDGEHLANHLAFTAMLHGDDHEEWLDEHVPGWGELNPDGLAGRVAEFADEAEYEEVFEDTVHDQARGHSHDLFDEERGEQGHDHTAGRSGGFDVNAARQRGDVELDEEAQQILSEAQELTEEMYGEAEADGTDDSGDDTGATGEADSTEDTGDAEGKDQ